MPEFELWLPKLVANILTTLLQLQSILIFSIVY